MQGGGFSWLFGALQGHPPLGWPDTIAYLVLPVALVASQFVTQRIMQPPSQDPQQQQTAGFLKFLPFLIGAHHSWRQCASEEDACRARAQDLLMQGRVCKHGLLQPMSRTTQRCCLSPHKAQLSIHNCAGWFSLNVPSGLTLYWFTNNLLSTGQQLYLKQQAPPLPDSLTSSNTGSSNRVRAEDLEPPKQGEPAKSSGTVQAT